MRKFAKRMTESKTDWNFREISVVSLIAIHIRTIVHRNRPFSVSLLLIQSCNQLWHISKNFAFIGFLIVNLLFVNFFFLFLFFLFWYFIDSYADNLGLPIVPLLVPIDSYQSIKPSGVNQPVNTTCIRQSINQFIKPSVIYQPNNTSPIKGSIITPVSNQSINPGSPATTSPASPYQYTSVLRQTE